MKDNSRFDGKVAIVTGSSSGIGESIALMLAQRGASVTLCGRSKERLECVADKCRKASGGFSERFIYVQGDLVNSQVQKDIVNKTVEKFGQLDILIANAGIGPTTKFGYDSEEMYDLIMATNLKSVYFLTQFAMTHLEKSKGNVVFVSSVISTSAFSTHEIYAMGKAAMDHLTRLLAFSRAKKGVRVNCINPTLVMTRIMDHDQVSRTTKSLYADKLARSHPLHGRASTAEEQAEAAVFLASDRASFITGQCLKVDGGISLGVSKI